MKATLTHRRLGVAFLTVAFCLAGFLPILKMDAQPARMSADDIFNDLGSESGTLKKKNKVLINKVKQRGVNFTITPQLKVQLKNAGATEALIETIIEKSKPLPTATGTISRTPTPTQPPTQTPTQPPTPTPTRTPIPTNSSNITPTPSVEPSASPSPQLAKIDEIIAKMNIGNLAFVAPEAMTLDRSETVYLKLSIAQTIEQIQEEIKQEGLKGKIDAVKGIKIDSQMQAVLNGGDDFKVMPITPDTLPVSTQTTTEWKWDVRPLRGGNLKLYLTLNAIVEYEDGAGKRPVTIKTFDKVYIVAVPWSENTVVKFFGNNWQWLWTTLIVPVGLWVWNRKRKKPRKKGKLSK